jgi:hypothetical protein
MYVVRFGGPSPHALHFRRPHLLGRGAIPQVQIDSEPLRRQQPRQQLFVAAAAAAAPLPALASSLRLSPSGQKKKGQEEKATFTPS